MSPIYLACSRKRKRT